MTVRVRPRGGRWQYDIHLTWPEGGEYRERKNTPCTSKSTAQRFAEARERALLAAGKGGMLFLIRFHLNSAVGFQVALDGRGARVSNDTCQVGDRVRPVRG